MVVKVFVVGVVAVVAVVGVDVGMIGLFLVLCLAMFPASLEKRGTFGFWTKGFLLGLLLLLLLWTLLLLLILPSLSLSLSLLSLPLSLSLLLTRRFFRACLAETLLLLMLEKVRTWLAYTEELVDGFVALLCFAA